jgi:hypothetical protein
MGYNINPIYQLPLEHFPRLICSASPQTTFTQQSPKTIMKLSKYALSMAFMADPTAIGGPSGYGVCQAGCHTLVVACYAAAGAIFGTVAAVVAPPAIIACNAAFGTCQAACAAVLLAPTL